LRLWPGWRGAPAPLAVSSNYRAVMSRRCSDSMAGLARSSCPRLRTIGTSAISPNGTRDECFAHLGPCYERPKSWDCEGEAILVPARARLSGSLRLQKLFSRQSGRRSWRGLLSSHCRGCYKNNVGTILPPSSEFFAPDPNSVMASRAPALDLRLEQLQARISGKRQHQLRCFCASFGSQLRSLCVSDLASSAIRTGWQVGTKSPVRVRHGSLAGQCKVRPPMKPAAVLVLWATNSSSSSRPPPTLQ
jgi:hypothetical protein